MNSNSAPRARHFRYAAHLPLFTFPALIHELTAIECLSEMLCDAERVVQLLSVGVVAAGQLREVAPMMVSDECPSIC